MCIQLPGQRPVSLSAGVSRVPQSVGVLLGSAVEWLRGASDTPRLDAELLLAAVMDCERVWLMAHADAEVAAHRRDRFAVLLRRRAAGEPMAYVLERQEFWSLSLWVTPAVLIPRADTELLVERALQMIAGRPAPRVLDLGTGSGAVALAVAHAREDARVIATDISTAALEVAAENGRRLELSERVRWVCGYWFDSLATAQQFDIIVSNPPYVAVADSRLQPAVAAHEPARALYAEAAGLGDLRRIAALAPQYLMPGGAVLLEHAPDQAQEVRQHLRDAGLADVRTWPDLSGRPRVSGGHRP